MDFKLTASGDREEGRQITVRYEGEIIGIVECDRDGIILCENRLYRKYLTKDNVLFLLAFVNLLHKCAGDFETQWFRTTASLPLRDSL